MRWRLNWQRSIIDYRCFQWHRLQSVWFFPGRLSPTQAEACATKPRQTRHCRTGFSDSDSEENENCVESLRGARFSHWVTCSHSGVENASSCISLRSRNSRIAHPRGQHRKPSALIQAVLQSPISCENYTLSRRTTRRVRPNECYPGL
jgi:hypothetical protein